MRAFVTTLMLNWNARSRGLILSRRICGVLVILGGLYLLTIAPR